MKHLVMNKESTFPGNFDAETLKPRAPSRGSSGSQSQGRKVFESDVCKQCLTQRICMHFTYEHCTHRSKDTGKVKG